jgi:hypothetical protein
MILVGQVRLVRLQTDNFRLFLRQQTNKRQLPFARWANGKRIKENRMGFRFPFSVWCLYLHVNGIPHAENGTNGKRQLPFVFFKRETEMANFRFFFVCWKLKRKKRKFVFLGRRTINGNPRLLFQIAMDWLCSEGILQNVDRCEKEIICLAFRRTDSISNRLLNTALWPG